MKVVGAFLLAVLGGNTNLTSDDIKSIFASVGVEAEDAMIDLLLKQVEGKDVAELIDSGRERLASVCVGGGAVVAPTGGAPAGLPKAEEKEEKEEIIQEEEEDDDDVRKNGQTVSKLETSILDIEAQFQRCQ